MSIAFRPVFKSDDDRWLPALRAAFAGREFDLVTDDADTSNVEYLITWKVKSGDTARFPRLKAILSLGAGVNHYLSSPHYPTGIPLIRMIDPGMTQSMTEYVVSYVMRFHREHDRLEPLARERDWTGLPIPRRASQRQIGILGLGELGQSAAAALSGLGFPVRGWSRSATTLPGIRSFHGPDQWNEFLSGLDILICLLPLTPDTEGILSRATLSRLSPGAYLINVARGAHLVDNDLIELLNENHLAGAALDVFTQEPLPEDHPFYRDARIHLTPHMAANTMPDTAPHALRHAIDCLERGETPPGLVDWTRGY